MPIEILAGMVVVGLALAIAAVRFSGLSRGATIADRKQAEIRFGEEFAQETVRDCRIAADGNAAFLRLESGRCGILLTFGSKYVARLVEPAPGLASANAAKVTVESGDFTFPKSVYVLATPADASTVAEWLNGTRR